MQRFLMWMLQHHRGRELAKIASVVMLACPTNGADYLGSVRRVLGFGRHPQAGRLAVLDNQVADTQRTILRDVVNAQGVDDNRCQIPFHVYAGDSDRVVLRASAQAAFPGAASVPGNHFSILDPTAQGNRTAQVVQHHLAADLAAWRPGRDRTAAPGPGPGPGPGPKFAVNIGNAQGTVVGDHTVVTQSFGMPAKPAQPPEGGADVERHGDGRA
jgi:hypothetical protein